MIKEKLFLGVHGRRSDMRRVLLDSPLALEMKDPDPDDLLYKLLQLTDYMDMESFNPLFQRGKLELNYIGSDRYEPYHTISAGAQIRKAMRLMFQGRAVPATFTDMYLTDSTMKHVIISVHYDNQVMHTSMTTQGRDESGCTIGTALEAFQRLLARLTGSDPMVALRSATQLAEFQGTFRMDIGLCDWLSPSDEDR